MSRITVATAFAALAVMLSGIVGMGAQAEPFSGGSTLSLSDPANPLSQNTTGTPAWLTSTRHDAFYFGPTGLTQGTASESTVKLGDGLSAGLLSSLSSNPAPGAWSAGAAPALANLSATSGLYARTPGALNMDLNGGLTSFSNPTPASSFGGRVSQDLGNGVSLSLTGGVTRDPGGAAFITPRGGLYMSPSSATSATIGGAMSVDLGGGSSFSIGAGATKGSSRCDALSAALCR